MADPMRVGLSTLPSGHKCSAQIQARVKTMLPLIISLFRRDRRFVWSPAVDLSDPYVAAALAPMTHS